METNANSNLINLNSLVFSKSEKFGKSVNSAKGDEESGLPPQKRFNKKMSLNLMGENKLPTKKIEKSKNLPSAPTKEKEKKKKNNILIGDFGVLPPKLPPSSSENEQRRNDVLGQHSFMGVGGKQCYFNLKVSHT